MKRSTASAVAGITLLVLLVADTAPAFPGRNGLIVFASDADENLTPQLFSVRPDGSGRRNLTRNRYTNVGGVWSPDGRQIAFFQLNIPGSALVVMNADGSNSRQVTDTQQWASDPSWSPDGSLIAYVQNFTPAGIHVVRPDGSGDRLIGPGIVGSGLQPTWSPDGRRLAVVRDTASVRALTVLDVESGISQDLVRGGYYRNPVWSPDGSSIAY